MTGLPNTADNIKAFIKWSALSFIGLFVLWLVWLILLFIFNTFFPPPSNQPDLAFGKIVAPFNYNSSFSSNVFSLDTPGGNIPNQPKILPVYALTPNVGEFASLDNAKAKARNGGLDSDPTQLSENQWRWTNTRLPNKSLVFNIVTNNFVYHYDWVADPSALDGVFKTTEKDITEKARSYLANFNSLNSDIKTSSTRVTYWKLSGSNRQKVSSFSEANAVEVEIFRDKLAGKYSLVEANSTLAQINVLLSPSNQGDKQLLEINYNYWNYDLNKKATYPVRSGPDAYSALKRGEAFIPNLPTLVPDSISIETVSLAYFNPNSSQNYLEPVYVFEGTLSAGNQTQDFTAYVPAISSQYQL